MTASVQASEKQTLAAYVAPFAIFTVGSALVSAMQTFAPGGRSPLWLAEPQYWVYPLQAVACAAVLGWFWKCYEWGTKLHTATGIVAGLLVLAIWVSPQWIFGTTPRTDGFNPDTFVGNPALWWGTVTLRFLRLVVIVPLLEEIFWRGFLMRYFIKEDFTKVSFGEFTWLSFGAVALGFTLEHLRPDWPAAAIAAVIYNLVAVKTRSLACCVIAHAVTNLGLGIYIMQTKQWGFW